MYVYLLAERKYFSLMQSIGIRSLLECLKFENIQELLSAYNVVHGRTQRSRNHQNPSHLQYILSMSIPSNFLRGFTVQVPCYALW